MFNLPRTENHGYLSRNYFYNSSISRERFIADLVDLRYYSNQSNSLKWYLKWLIHFLNTVGLLPCLKKSALAVSNTFRNMFSTFGSPFILHIDNEKNFAILVYQIYVMNLILGMLKVEQDAPGFKAR